MSEDLLTPGTPMDRSIAAEQIDDWAISLQVTPQRVREAILAVGRRVVDVRRHLAGGGFGLSGRGAASVLPHLHRQNLETPQQPHPEDGTDAAGERG